MTTTPVELTPSVVVALVVVAMIVAWLYACCVIVIRRDKGGDR